MISCDRCRTPLPDAFLNTPAPVPCPGCHAPLLARVFPAFARGGSAPGLAAESIANDEDASCFFHPRKKAVVPCARCGRFLCALCDLEIDGRHLCPSCVADPAAGGGVPGAAGRTVFANERTLHDRVALGLAVWPLLLWPFTLFCAPVAFYFAVRHWNSPKQGLIPRSRWRLVLAVVFSLTEMVCWCIFGYYLLTARTGIPF